MAEEKKTVNVAVEEKETEAIKKDDSVNNESAVKASDSKEKEEVEKEELSDSEIIDINKEQPKEEVKPQNKKKEHGVGGKNPPKTTDDFIAKQKKRKKTRKIITLLIVVIIILAIVLWVKNAINKTKEALKDLQANSVQTATVEKKTLYDSKDATGTLYALESRTLTTNLGQIVAKINSVNVEVGDHVQEGDILVEFSREEVDKSISEQKEDIYTQKQQDAIDAADAQRNYVYSYTSVANNIQDAAEKVDRALKALHEACNAYGEAKSERDKIKNMSDDEIIDKYSNSSGTASAQANSENMDDDEKKAVAAAAKATQAQSIRKSALASAEEAVTRTFQAQETAQQNYDDAVEAQARTINDSQTGNGSLSSADSSYKKSQITSGQQVKQLQRKLETLEDSLDDYIVTASISGVVTEINVSEGNRFNNGNVLTIQDDSGYKAEVLVDEYDISKVKKAYETKKNNGEQLKVVVKTDATGDEEFIGHVTSIAPTSTSTTTGGGSSSSGSSAASAASSSSSGTANYKVSIELDDVDEAFMIGMSAKVAIVVDESPDNSLCVPYNCIEEKDGKYYVRVMDENGDKSTADNMMQGMAGKPEDPENSDDSDDTKGVNGIVIENNGSDSGEKGHSRRGGKKDGFLSKLTGDKGGEQVELGRRYREEEVEKIFETDFYAAVIPKTEGSIKEGDEVMIVTEKSSGNDIMAMFSRPGGGPDGF